MNAISGGGPPISARLPISQALCLIDHTSTGPPAPAQQRSDSPKVPARRCPRASRRRAAAPLLFFLSAVTSLSACHATTKPAPAAVATTLTPGPGFLGVVVRTLSAPLALQFGLTPQPGAVVLEVTSGSPAAAANLAPGDVIVDVANTPIGSGAALKTVLRRDHAGQRLVLTVLTGSTRHRVAVVLAPLPPTS